MRRGRPCVFPLLSSLEMQALQNHGLFMFGLSHTKSYDCFCNSSAFLLCNRIGQRICVHFLYELIICRSHNMIENRSLRSLKEACDRVHRSVSCTSLRIHLQHTDHLNCIVLFFGPQFNWKLLPNSTIPIHFYQ